MVILLLSIFLSFVFFIILRRYFSIHQNSEYVKSDVDGEYYLVRKTNFKQEAADLLANIKSRIHILLVNLDVSDCPFGLSENIKLLKIRHKSMSLSENIYMEDTAFTMNKQETMICLSTRDNNQHFYDINKLMFVTLHELTHVGCKQYGHGEEFVKFFIYLLKKSIELDLYTYKNYDENPEEYCGIMINKTPIN